MCLKGSRSEADLGLLQHPRWSTFLESLICGPVFKNGGGILLLKTTALLDVNLNNRVVEHHKRCGLFSDFHCGFRSSRSTSDLLTVVSDRLARAFDRSETWYITVTLDISKGFYRVWHTGLLQKLISYGISGWLFVYILSFLRNNRLWWDLGEKSS